MAVVRLRPPSVAVFDIFPEPPRGGYAGLLRRNAPLGQQEEEGLRVRLGPAFRCCRRGAAPGQVGAHCAVWVEPYPPEPPLGFGAAHRETPCSLLPTFQHPTLELLSH